MIPDPAGGAPALMPEAIDAVKVAILRDSHLQNEKRFLNATPPRGVREVGNG